MTIDELVGILSDPQVRISTAPFNTMLFANYVKDTGSIKKTPANWKDHFFAVAHQLSGG